MATLRYTTAPAAGGGGVTLSSIDFTSPTVTDPGGAVSSSSGGDGTVTVTTTATAHASSSNQQITVAASGFSWPSGAVGVILECTLPDMTAQPDSSAVGLFLSTSATADGVGGWVLRTAGPQYSAVASPDSGGHVLGSYDSLPQATVPTKLVVSFWRGYTAGAVDSNGTVLAQIFDSGGNPLGGWEARGVTFGTLTHYHVVIHGQADAHTVTPTGIRGGAITIA